MSSDTGTNTGAPLHLDYLDASQAQPEVKINDAWNKINAFAAGDAESDTHSDTSGLPDGGTTGQVLGKLSDADLDVGWIDQSGGGGSDTHSDTGASLTVSDGTTTVTDVTEIVLISGATVSEDGAGVAHIFIDTSSDSSGGSGDFNITPDSHASVPTGVGLGPNDEFEFGSAIDTLGSRYDGAVGWTVAATTMGEAVKYGSLTAVGTATGGSNALLMRQPISANPTWQYIAKLRPPQNNSGTPTGMLLGVLNAANGNSTQCFYFENSNMYLQQNTMDLSTGQPSFVGNGAHVPVTNPGQVWMSIRSDGTDIYVGYSLNGFYFIEFASEAISANVGTITDVCLCMQGVDENPDNYAICDYFRQVA